MAEQERLAGRNGEIWRRYCRGATFEKLGREYGITPQRAHQIVQAVRDSIPQAVRAEVIQEEVDLYRALRDEVLAVWDAGPAPVLDREGRPVLDPATNAPVYDHKGRLHALQTAVSISARYAALLGLDAAANKADVGGAESEASRLAAEAEVARLAAEEGQ